MITPEEVRRLFELAKIEASAQELERFPQEIEAILEYIKQLSSAPLGDISPTLSFAPDHAHLRPDAYTVPDNVTTKLVTGQFPESSGGLLKTKKVFGNS